MGSGLKQADALMMLRTLVLLACAALLAGCATTPPVVARQASYTLADTGHTWLGRVTRERLGASPGESAVVLLNTGREAFESRIALTDAAEASLDAQYYIWNTDTTGRLLAERILRAAGRGVRVRLLLDDFGVGHKDHELFALDTHPNIEVRVYNPFRAGYRSGPGKWLNFALGFNRLIRRMHSKTFVVDNSFAIVGGRNIGDEYFDARRDMNHRDRELLSAGPVVKSVSRQFDAMWNSPWAIPISALVRFRLSPEAIKDRYLALRAYATNTENAPYPLPGGRAAAERRVARWLDTAVRARAEFVYNPPRITGGDENQGKVIANRLLALLEASQREVLVESAYFIVSDRLLEQVAPLIGKGLSIKALTNSLATTDVWTIHAGYTRNRKAMLRRGIALYEFRPDAASCRRLVDNERLDCAHMTFSLHAKSVVFDRKVVYVGSFNLNPRSSVLNTETALIVYSAALAERVARDIEENMLPENSWRVQLNEAGELEWRSRDGGQTRIATHEPDSGFWLRLKTFVFSWLPVEKYL